MNKTQKIYLGVGLSVLILYIILFSIIYSKPNPLIDNLEIMKDKSQQLSDEEFKQILPLDSSLRLINHQFDLEHKMIKSVQDYHGSENWKTIVEALRENIERKYSKSDLLHPDTEMGWHGYHADTRSRNHYDVYFTIKTPNEESEYLWGVVISNEKVFPKRTVFDNQEAIDIFYIAERGFAKRTIEN